jgi:hypothetical protein
MIYDLCDIDSDWRCEAAAQRFTSDSQVAEWLKGTHLQCLNAVSGCGLNVFRPPCHSNAQLCFAWRGDVLSTLSAMADRAKPPKKKKTESVILCSIFLYFLSRVFQHNKIIRSLHIQRASWRQDAAAEATAAGPGAA